MSTSYCYSFYFIFYPGLICNLILYISVLADGASVAQWLTQYFLKLQYNVMMQEDRKNMWTSEGMAELGMSFWYVRFSFVFCSRDIELKMPLYLIFSFLCY